MVDFKIFRLRLSQFSTLFKSLMRFSSSSTSRPGNAAAKPLPALLESVVKGNWPGIWPAAFWPHMVLNISRL